MIFVVILFCAVILLLMINAPHINWSLPPSSALFLRLHSNASHFCVTLLNALDARDERKKGRLESALEWFKRLL